MHDCSNKKLVLEKLVMKRNVVVIKDACGEQYKEHNRPQPSFFYIKNNDSYSVHYILWKENHNQQCQPASL